MSKFLGLQKFKKEEAIGSPGSKFFCARCSSMIAGTMVKEEKLCDGIEIMKGFCYLGDRLHASGSSEAAVTIRTRIGWVKFRECGDFHSYKTNSAILFSDTFIPYQLIKKKKCKNMIYHLSF